MVESAETDQNPEAFLERFGLQSFRAGQRPVIDAVLAGDDCLCIMPTGGGKSLCYQLPSIAREGLTLVISPLIALMKDQVDSLQARGIRADFINSSLQPAEQQQRLSGLAAGAYDLLYVAPERFRSRRFVELLKDHPIRLLAVDEAHCISEWGHDFRHDFARLGQYRERIGNPPTIALTATATPDVQVDIVKQLALDDPQVFVAGFARDNLHYNVISHSQKSDKDESLRRLIRNTEGSGIVYVSTRKNAEAVTDIIQQSTHRTVAAYHAGLPPDERRAVQDGLMDGEIDIVVATNAFGMGIDKSDIRFVIHFNMPGTLEAYYQEAGRAGRDGDPSQCVLLYSAADRHIQNFFIENAYPDPAVVEEVYDYLCSLDDDPIEITQQDLLDGLDLDANRDCIGTCERLLEKGGAIQRLEPFKNMAVVQLDKNVLSLAEYVPPNARNMRKVARHAQKVIGDRRDEPVYFHMYEWQEALDMKPESLKRAIRELNEMECFHYTPAFRGRAVKVVDRNKPFDELEIDFATLEKRKRADYAKLNQVVAYAHTSGCRQLQILRYFGDSSGKPCGHCDNCGPAKSGSATGGSRNQASATEMVDLTSDGAVRHAVRVALSGVARARQRFGKTIIAQMLCGSQAAKVTKFGLQKLSTFGLLQDFRQSEVVALIEALILSGLLVQEETERFRPIIHLTDEGHEVMHLRANASDLLMLPTRTAQKLRRIFKAHANDPGPQEEEPAAEPEVAAVATADSGDSDSRDSDSRDSDSSDSDSSDSDSGDSDSGDSHTESSGSTVHQSANVTAEVAATAAADFGNEEFYWTWRLLSDSYCTFEEVVAIRGIAREAAWEHLCLAAERGLSIPVSELFSSDDRQTLDEHLAAADVGELSSNRETRLAGTGWNRATIDEIAKSTRVDLNAEQIRLYAIHKHRATVGTNGP